MSVMIEVLITDNYCSFACSALLRMRCFVTFNDGIRSTGADMLSTYRYVIFPVNVRLVIKFLLARFKVGNATIYWTMRLDDHVLLHYKIG